MLRRLIRRTIRCGKLLDIKKKFCPELVSLIVQGYKKTYPKLLLNKENIRKQLIKEEIRFTKSLKSGLEFLKKESDKKKISGKKAFELFSTHGLSPEQLKQEGYWFDQKEFAEEMKKHQRVSRKGMKQKFAGGLQDKSKQVIKLHTATHLLHQALRQVLGDHVQQVGSNITAERLRFDFIHPQSLTQKEIKKVEDLVNEQIKKNLKITCRIMNLAKARKQGALAFFGQKYPDKVRVYFIGAFSKEVCGGPHADFTGNLGKFRIKKEESCGAGKRRIYGELVK